MTTITSPRKPLLALAGAAGLALALAACSAPATSATSTPESIDVHGTTVEVVYPGLPFVAQSITDTLGQSFQDKTGITVKFIETGTGYTDVQQRVTNDIAAGTRSDLILTSYSGIRTYAEQGIAAQLDPYINDGSFDTSQFEPKVLQLGSQNGATYALPYGTSSLVLYYNQDVFNKAGISAPPTNYDEMMADAATIVKSGAAANGLVMNADSDNWRLQNILSTASASYMNTDETEVTLASDESLGVLQNYYDMAKAGTLTTGTDADVSDAFRRGDAGMILHSSANLKALTDNVTFDAKTTVVPLPDNGTRALPPAGPALVMTATDPRQQAATWRVMQELVSPQGSTTLTTNTGYVPLNKTAIADPALLGTVLKDEPNRQPAIDEAADYTSWYAWPGTNGVQINSILADDFGAILAGTKTPKDAMTDATGKIEPLLP
jgi:multiple sugar transport system substrate-binding protein